MIIGVGGSVRGGGQELQLPLNRNRGRQKAYLAIARLIFQFARNRDRPSVRPKRFAEIRSRGNLHVLSDKKFALKDGDSLFNGRQVKNLGSPIDRRPNL